MKLNPLTGNNLLDIHSSQMNTYVTAVMKVLFTNEELNGGYIIEGKSTSKRRPLDLERVNILKGKIF